MASQVSQRYVRLVRDASGPSFPDIEVWDLSAPQTFEQAKLNFSVRLPVESVSQGTIYFPTDKTHSVYPNAEGTVLDSLFVFPRPDWMVTDEKLVKVHIISRCAGEGSPLYIVDNCIVKDPFTTARSEAGETEGEEAGEEVAFKDVEIHLTEKICGITSRTPSNTPFTVRKSRWQPGKVIGPEGERYTSVASECAAFYTSSNGRRGETVLVPESALPTYLRPKTIADGEAGEEETT